MPKINLRTIDVTIPALATLATTSATLISSDGMTSARAATYDEMFKDHFKQLVLDCSNPDLDTATSKKEIYHAKCWLDELYATIPEVKDEKDWGKERVLNRLKGLDDKGKELSIL